jgi:hypothetical protein
MVTIPMTNVQKTAILDVSLLKSCRHFFPNSTYMSVLSQPFLVENCIVNIYFYSETLKEVDHLVYLDEKSELIETGFDYVGCSHLP